MQHKMKSKVKTDENIRKNTLYDNNNNNNKNKQNNVCFQNIIPTRNELFFVCYYFKMCYNNLRENINV